MLIPSRRHSLVKGSVSGGEYTTGERSMERSAAGRLGHNNGDKAAHSLCDAAGMPPAAGT